MLLFAGNTRGQHLPIYVTLFAFPNIHGKEEEEGEGEGGEGEEGEGEEEEEGDMFKAMFCIYLRTNSDLCHLQHKLIGFYNPDKKCLQRGTDWVFK